MKNKQHAELQFANVNIKMNMLANGITIRGF